MDFGGEPPPPRNKTYFPSSFSEAQWKQIEENTLNYSSDLKGWKEKFEEEKLSIENRLKKEYDWLEETDWLIRMVRICDEEELTEIYQTQFNAQQRYIEKVKARHDLLDIKIHCIMMLESKNSSGEKQKMA